MKIQRTLPPAAALVHWEDLRHGLGGMMSGKRALRRLEEEIRAYFCVKHVFLVSSGRAALVLVLQALRSMSRRTEVLIPAYTCFSVPSAIVKAGLNVALCDVDPHSLGFDLGLLEKAITEKTLCVVPGHLFGVPSDLDRIRGLCEGRGAVLVEDAAQAMGGFYGSRKLGTIGDVGIFSLGRGKNITCGSGGILITNSDPIAEAIAREYSTLAKPGIRESVRDFLSLLAMAVFIHPPLYWFPAGLPFLRLGETRFETDFPVKRLSGVKAGFLRNWRRRLEESNRARSEAASSWICDLALADTHRATIPYLRLPLLAGSREERDREVSLSKRGGLGISVMYPSAINEIEELRAAFDGRSYPSAQMVSERLLTLPTHPLLSRQDQRRIARLFNRGARRQDALAVSRSEEVPGS